MFWALVNQLKRTVYVMYAIRSIKTKVSDLYNITGPLGILASLVTLALPFGSLITGPLMDRWGRKKMCMVTAFPFIFSWVLQANAREVWHIYLARIIAGFSAGEYQKTFLQSHETNTDR